MIANYIFVDSIVLYDDIEFDAYLSNQAALLNSVIHKLILWEVARARNCLYWIELEPGRRYITATRVSMFCELMERLARVWHLCVFKPYPYKKWLLKDLDSDPAAAALVREANNILLEIGKGYSEQSVTSMRKVYQTFIDLLSVRNQTPAELKQFELNLPSTDYYKHLDW